MRGSLLLWVLAALGIIASLFAIGVLLIWLERPAYADWPRRAVPPPIPAYPNAQSITQGKEDRYYQVTRFDTTDSPETELRFYYGRLTKQGEDSWEADWETRRLPGDAPGRYMAIGCPYIHSLMVDVDQTVQGLTHVTLRIYQTQSCY